MATNQFYTWAAAPAANALTNSAYYGLTTLRASGFQPGIASSEQANTVLRQSSTVAAAIGALVAYAGGDAIDNGDVDALRDAIIAAIRYATRDTVPVGTVITTYAPTAPDGYLPLRGAFASRAEYTRLFEFAQASGLLVSEASWNTGGMFTKFSSGDGVSTFRLPDLRGLHVRVTDEGRGMDIGRLPGTYQPDQMPQHNHILNFDLRREDGYGQIAGGGGVADGTWSGTTDTTGTGNETRVKNVSLFAYIKV